MTFVPIGPRFDRDNRSGSGPVWRNAATAAIGASPRVDSAPGLILPVGAWILVIWWMLVFGGSVAHGQLFEWLRQLSDPTPQEPHPAIVRVVVRETDGVSLGSGTHIWSQGQYAWVVSNWHVVRSAPDRVEVAFPNGFRSPAQVVRTDEKWDLALLAIWRPPTEPMPVSAVIPQVGERITIAGYGQGDYRAATAPCAHYAAPDPQSPNEMIEISVPARQGDSGGPLMNARGELAGVLFGTGQGLTTGSHVGRVRQFLAEASAAPPPTEPVAPAFRGETAVSAAGQAPSNPASSPAVANGSQGPWMGLPPQVTLDRGNPGYLCEGDRCRIVPRRASPLPIGRGNPSDSEEVAAKLPPPFYPTATAKSRGPEDVIVPSPLATYVPADRLELPFPEVSQLAGQPHRSIQPAARQITNASAPEWKVASQASATGTALSSAANDAANLPPAGAVGEAGRASADPSVAFRFHEPPPSSPADSVARLPEDNPTPPLSMGTPVATEPPSGSLSEPPGESPREVTLELPLSDTQAYFAFVLVLGLLIYVAPRAKAGSNSVAESDEE